MPHCGDKRPINTNMVKKLLVPLLRLEPWLSSIKTITILSYCGTPRDRSMDLPQSHSETWQKREKTGRTSRESNLSHPTYILSLY
jgi:hypothetical protein